MLLRQFMLDVGPLESNAWLLADEQTREALLFDAGAFEPGIATLIDGEKLKLTHIVLTHHHWDHVDGLPEYRRRWPEAKLISPPPVDKFPDALIARAGEKLELDPFELQIFRTSGHTPESVSYYCAAAGACFVGDAIFAGSVGGTKSDELFEEQKNGVLAMLRQLPPQTELCPGHGPATTVEIELAANPFLKPGFGR